MKRHHVSKRHDDTCHKQTYIIPKESRRLVVAAEEDIQRKHIQEQESSCPKQKIEGHQWIGHL